MDDKTRDYLDKAKEAALRVAQGDGARMISEAMEPAELLAACALEELNEFEPDLGKLGRYLEELNEYHKQLRRVAASLILKDRFDLDESEASKLIAEVAECLEQKEPDATCEAV